MLSLPIQCLSKDLEEEVNRLSFLIVSGENEQQRKARRLALLPILVTMKITFGICRILILNNFLIGHAVPAANEKADFSFPVLIGSFTWCSGYTCAYNENGELI